MGKITSESSDKGPVPQQAATSSRSAPQLSHGSVPQFMAARSPPMQHNVFQPPPDAGIPAGYPVLQHDPFTVNTQSNDLYLQALQQTIQNINAMTQAILAGGLGGLGAGGVSGVGGGFGAGDCGGDNGFQQLMQFYSSLDCGGGGGEQEILHALMAGGGSGSGGGRIDVSQSFLSANESLDRLGGIK